MSLTGRMTKFYSGNAIILAVIFVLVSVLISVFNTYYFSSTIKERKAMDYSRIFVDSSGNFAETAKSALNSRPNIIYVKLLDENGVLQESYGIENGEDLEIFPITTPENKTIVLGLSAESDKSLILSSALWSALIGLGISVILLFVFSLVSDEKSEAPEKLISAMKSVARGDRSVKLDTSDALDDVTMIRAYEAFNQMVERLRTREEFEEPEEKAFQPKLIETETTASQGEHKKPGLRNVTVLVAKIADYQELSATLDPSEFNMFLADYRKAASAIISNYGGVIEALLKDEIVAFFNVPDIQTKPELRAICSAVEVLQHLAGITRERKLEGKTAISGKIGIGLKPLKSYEDSEVPQGIKQVTDISRKISEVAPIWRVIISQDVYNIVSDYVEARELKLGSESYYSVVGVEEGLI